MISILDKAKQTKQYNAKIMFCMFSLWKVYEVVH